MTPTERAAEIAARLERSTGLNVAGWAADLIADAIRQAERETRRETIERCARVAEHQARSVYNEHNRNLGVAHHLVDTCEDVAEAIRTLSPDNQADKSKEQR